VDQATPELSAIVVARDSGPDLLRSLRSVHREAERAGIAAELLLVDNASRDGMPQAAAAEIPGVRLLRNERNVGFGAGVNQGFRAARGRRVLLFNPDAELHDGALAPLMRVLDGDPDLAVAAPALWLPGGRLQDSARRFYDAGAILAQRTPWAGTSRGRRALRRHTMEAEKGALDGRSGAAGDPLRVDWVTGAAMLVDRDSVPAQGPFDERYFLYFEDVDLCRRLRAGGRGVAFVPSAQASHAWARGSRRHVPWNPLLWRHIQSGLLYALRWSHGWWRSRWWRVAALRGGAVLARAGLLAATAAALSFALALDWSLPLALLGTALLPVPRLSRVGRPPLPGLFSSWIRLLLAALIVGTLAAPGRDLLGLGAWAAAAAAALHVARHLGRAALRWSRRLGLGHTACLLAGDPDAAAALARALAEQPSEGLQAVGFVPLDAARPGGPTPRLPDWERVVEVAADLRAPAVLLAGSAEDLARMAGGVDALRRAGVDVAFAMTGPQELLQPHNPEQIAGLPVLGLGAGAETRASDAVTSMCGRCFAALGLFLLLPAAPLLLTLSAAAAGRFPLVGLPRLGQALRPFRMWRLRSGPEGADGAGDSGGGALGAFLRATHLDELPQLWNVVRGEMALVGPRPVDAELAARLAAWERARFRVRPGITGMWQLDRLRRWRLEQMIASDLLYLLRRRPALDLRILGETLLGRRNP
jgi:GT2 family glycosyltransferase/lipopolysaccharide/colanic/teichoic acid biosynthesis glycosyltransferase